MPPFRFRLQQVLEYREQLENQAQMVFGQAQAAYDRQIEVIAALRVQLAENETKLYEQLSQGERWLLENFKKGIEQDIAGAENHLLELAQQLNRARMDLVQKSQDKKLLDKLKEKQARQHAEEERAKEQLQFDETATLRYKPQAF